MDSQRRADAEITPEMVSAGVAAPWPCELLAYQVADEVLAQVYVAMETASRPST